MLKKSLFRKPKNELEYQGEGKLQRPSVPDDLYVSCPECKQTLLKAEVEEHCFICPKCNYHFKLQARRRIRLLVDNNSFQELNAGLQPVNWLEFPSYEEKLTAAQQKSGEPEGVICGTAQIGGYPVALFVMDPAFILGSMGTVVGEKITRLFEYAPAGDRLYSQRRCPYAGRHPVINADGQNQWRSEITQRRWIVVCDGAYQSHHRRSDSQLCYGR